MSLDVGWLVSFVTNKVQLIGLNIICLKLQTFKFTCEVPFISYQLDKIKILCGVFVFYYIFLLYSPFLD